MGKSGIVKWRAPSNIALIKYWGKNGFQIPANPSISMTLSHCYTDTTITYSRRERSNSTEMEFYFEGERDPLFEKKIRRFLQLTAGEFPELRNLNLLIESGNSFPASAGIASSASSFSSMALCLLSIQEELTGSIDNNDAFLKKASSLARLGSGSASRSVYGGWVLWGKTYAFEKSSDKYAVPLNGHIHNSFDDYYNAILVVDSSKKKISSSLGHKLMETNPYRKIRVETGTLNTLNLLSTLKNGNEKDFIEIVENETAQLQAMIITSKPQYILIKPETLEIIFRIIKFRKETGLVLCLTIDAGPNVHLIYPGKHRERVITFIESKLTELCEDGRWIDDKKGNGPEKLNE